MEEDGTIIVTYSSLFRDYNNCNLAQCWCI